MGEGIELRHREFAWPHRPSCYKDDAVTKRNWMDGVYDSVAVIQSFARFEQKHRHIWQNDATQRALNTLWQSHYYWLRSAKEALQGDLGKLRRHVAISEGMARETVLDDMAAALASPKPTAAGGK